MVGFTGTLSKEKKYKRVKSSTCFSDSYFSIKRTSNNKFLKDKLYFTHEGKFFLLEGVITNSRELINKYRSKSWKSTFLEMYRLDPHTFYKEFRGSFCGVIYDLNSQDLLLFVDPFRSKDIYYTINEGQFYFSTNLRDLAVLNKNNNSLDVDAAYLLLTFGGTLEKRTLFMNIKKLSYGSYMVVSSAIKLEEKSYFEIKIPGKVPSLRFRDSEHYIENLDMLFKKAINRQFSKDSEYGYTHLVALSAGRDSRMTTWVSHILGYDKALVFTFSESGQLDELIPKQITRDLNLDWIFKSLDNGNCFREFEDIAKISCGEVTAQTVLHGLSLYKTLNFAKLGFIHTGQLGDVIIGNFGSSEPVVDLDKIKYVYSKKLLNRVKERGIFDLNDYDSEEEFNYVNRGIGVTLKSASSIYQFTETFSPFNDLDFFSYCLTIPKELRRGVKLYDSWIKLKYPGAAKYPHNGRPIGAKEYTLFGKKTTIKQLPQKFYNKLRMVLSRTGKVNIGMNPMDYWYVTNKSLRASMDLYLESNISRIDNLTLKNDCEELYKSGNTGEKMQVLTLLSTLNLYFE